ncbi:hypothetical protein BKA83DRAFT_686474 [Pisolithus microcarpus]|nr:hypothetical protein BKA83DRAFT_686474 [Pisolithus microcarpus]
MVGGEQSKTLESTWSIWAPTHPGLPCVPTTTGNGIMANQLTHVYVLPRRWTRKIPRRLGKMLRNNEVVWVSSQSRRTTTVAKRNVVLQLQSGASSSQFAEGKGRREGE